MTAVLDLRPGTAVTELSSGEKLDLCDPDYRKITPQVIAHHLGNVCRYAGAVKRPYSVAEHCLLVVAYLEATGRPANVQLSGLHHDDAEFILGDMTRPMKERITEFKPIEHEFMEVIARALNFAANRINVELPEVKEADNWALAAEAYYLMPSQGRDWWSWGLYDPNSELAQLPEVLRLRLANMPHGTVRNLWMAKHINLLGVIAKESMRASA